VNRNAETSKRQNKNNSNNRKNRNDNNGMKKTARKKQVRLLID